MMTIWTYTSVALHSTLSIISESTCHTQAPCCDSKSFNW
jgi:hypothetical protein